MGRRFTFFGGAAGAIGAIALALVAGLLLRGANLGQNVYWVDEVHTALRLAGYTKETVTPLLSQPITVAELAPFQGAAGALPDTLRALAQHPEHPPLYYLTAWGALALAPANLDFVGLLRGVSLLFGLLALPATYWLSWELWRSPQVSALGLALVTLSPLHVLYAQEAREYSLWTSLTLISGAALLRAMRLGGPWWRYGLTVALGLYSHLLFGAVVLVHGLYVLLVGGKGRRGYWTATAIAVVAFSPWIWVGLQRRGQLDAVVEAVQLDTTLGYLIDVWARSLNRVFFNGDWGSANLLILGVALYSLYHLWRLRHSPSRRSALFVGLLVVIPAIGLLVPDLVFGGIRSTRIRYLIPCYLGLQLAIAHLFIVQLSQRRGWARRGWAAGLALLLAVSGGASLVSTQTPLSWAKSDKSAYYPAMAETINASAGPEAAEAYGPWVISDSSATYLLALARLLKPSTRLQLVSPPQPALPEPAVLDAEPPGTTLFLFDPSPRLKRLVQRDYGSLEMRVVQNDRFQLWQVLR
ncbi:MAG: hypothetical protein ACFB5Z_10385 [Elainellaceae cyanobacterium]